MPPKKDDKKKGGSGPFVPKVVDATQYLRKTVSLPSPDLEKIQPVHRASGKVVNIETLFPEWTNDEVWSEPIPPEKIPKISYPNVLGVTGSTTISQYYNLAADETADPKKKKDKKPPAKGAPAAEVEFSEQLVNEDGKPLPVIFRDDESGTSFQRFPDLRPFLKRRRVNATEEETGENAEDFVDPLLCDSFRIISEFAPRLVQHHGREAARCPRAVHEMDSNYLWRAIYPRLPNGKPCYNPGGKYCVKLFLAGKWRKVYVDDSLPLTSTGEIAVACSSDPLELWPVLLSKAIYSVYTACGYSFAETFHVAEQISSSVAQTAQAVKSTQPGQQSCQVLSFVLHLVTGWQPHHTTDASSLFLSELSKALKLLKAMHTAGVPNVPGSDIVGPEDMVRFRLSSDPTAASTASADATAPTEEPIPVVPPAGSPGGSPANPPTVMTKWKFKEEYLRRRTERQEIVDAIVSREKKIDAVHSRVQSSKREVFCIARYSPLRHRYIVSPILALSFPEGGDLEGLDIDNMLDTYVLLDWYRFSAVDVLPITTDPIILGRGQVPVAEFLQPFPKASPLRATWHRLSDLVEEGIYLTALFTFTHVDHQADWSCHWQPSAASTTGSDAAGKEAAAGGGGAKKKGKEAAPVVSAESEVYSSAGLPPPTFLALHAGQLFDQRASRADLEIQQALVAQESAMRRSVSQDLGEDAIAFFDVPPPIIAAVGGEGGGGDDDAVPLTIVIHADMTTEGEEESASAQLSAPSDAPSPSRPARRAMGKRQTSWDATCVSQQKVLPSDVILVVQEVRTDDETPLVFVTKLADTSLFPVAAKTFLIPKHRLPRDPKQPMLFWMRLFTKASVFISVRTAVTAQIGLAEELWPMGTAWNALVYEGDAQVTVDETEQLLFRLPLVLAPHSRSVEPAASSASPFGAPVSPSTNALVFFHLADPALEISTNLLLVSHKQGQSLGAEVLSDLQGQRLDLSQKDGHGEMLLGYAHCRDASRGSQLPSFRWKLVLLSQVPVIPPESPVQEVAVSQRYRGRYFPNSQYRLFRDVYSMDKSSFPLAMKLSVQPLDNQVFDRDEPLAVPLLLRLYVRGQENKPVAQYQGKNVLHVYYQTIAGFLTEASKDASTAPAPAAAAAAKKGGDKKGAAPAAVDTVEIIVDCQLDLEQLDIVPEGIFSRFPHVFDDLFEKNQAEEDGRPGVVAQKDFLSLQNQFLAIKPPSQALFTWEMDILAGRVVQCQHDVTSLARFSGVKNAWEDKTPGETERAQAALGYMSEKLKIVDIGRYLKNTDMAIDLAALGGGGAGEEASAKSPPSFAPPRLQVDWSAVMAENVTTALNGEMNDLQPRFQRLHGLPPMDDKVELIAPETNDEALKESLINPYNLMGEIGSDPWMQAAQSRRIDNKQRNEAFYERIRARTIELSALYRSDLNHRIHDLYTLHKQQRLQLAEAWNPREVYRIETEAKNTALAYALQRAREAKQVMREKEEAAALEQQKLEAKKAKKK